MNAYALFAQAQGSNVKGSVQMQLCSFLQADQLLHLLQSATEL